MTAVEPRDVDLRDDSGGVEVVRVAEREGRTGTRFSVCSADDGLKACGNAAAVQISEFGDSNSVASQEPKRVSRFKKEQLQRRREGL